MDIPSVYNQIPYDTSGSMSKNRFRQELFWGISKMFDLFDKDDFCVVFDYKCDIEIHLSDSLEFFQIKSHKEQSPYSFTKIKKRKGSSPSIIAKLFLLKDPSSPNLPIKCALVSNAYLRIGKTVFSRSETISFDELCDADKCIIENALCEELNRSSVNLSNMLYIYTSMNLISPQDDLKGKITGSFEKIMGSEPIKPNALYRLVVETASEKACYEFPVSDYEELKKHKGITKSELNDILNQHLNKVDNSVEAVHNYIDTQYSKIGKRHRLKTALARIVEMEYTSNELQEKEKEISTYICRSEVELTTEELTDLLLEEFGPTFSIEYGEDEKFVFIMLIIKRWEDGKYE